MDRLKRELDQLQLPTTGTKNELERLLREKLQQQGIDIESYEFEDEERELQRNLQAHAAPNDVDINSLLAAMMEKMQVARGTGSFYSRKPKTSSSSFVKN